MLLVQHLCKSLKLWTGKARMITRARSLATLILTPFQGWLESSSIPVQAMGIAWVSNSCTAMWPPSISYTLTQRTLSVVQSKSPWAKTSTSQMSGLLLQSLPIWLCRFHFWQMTILRSYVAHQLTLTIVWFLKTMREWQMLWSTCMPSWATTERTEVLIPIEMTTSSRSLHTTLIWMCFQTTRPQHSIKRQDPHSKTQ
jgi:hypothetical protein